MEEFLKAAKEIGPLLGLTGVSLTILHIIIMVVFACIKGNKLTKLDKDLNRIDNEVWLVEGKLDNRTNVINSDIRNLNLNVNLLQDEIVLLKQEREAKISKVTADADRRNKKLSPQAGICLLLRDALALDPSFWELNTGDRILCKHENFKDIQFILNPGAPDDAEQIKPYLHASTLVGPSLEADDEIRLPGEAGIKELALNLIKLKKKALEDNKARTALEKYPDSAARHVASWGY